MPSYKVVDLFAGAGGLSLGFCQTKCFCIKAAVEINPNAQATYLRNHLNTHIEGDICNVDFPSIQKEFDGIDVVIGGPPCQGFSNANRQKNHAISMNNRLVKEYVKAVEQLQPKVFVLENVEMLKSEVHRFFCELGETTTTELGINTKDDYILLLPETACDAKYDFLFAAGTDLTQYLIAPRAFKELKVLLRNSKRTDKYKDTLYKYKKSIEKHYASILKMESNVVTETWKEVFMQLKGIVSDNCLITIPNRLAEVVMVQLCVRQLIELHDNNIAVYEYRKNRGISAKVKSYSVLDYIKAVLAKPGNDYKFVSGVLNAVDFGVPQKRSRFILIGAKPEYTGSEYFQMPAGTYTPENYRTVRDAISDIEDCPTSFDANSHGTELPEIQVEGLAAELRDSKVLQNNIITDNGNVALQRFRTLKQGQNFHSLSKEMKENTYSDTTRTQRTIYWRLEYDQPSGTVLNVRKSMWIHPVMNRAISIREAARLQTFPDSFVFIGPKDSQYQQIGNAVPPMLAKAVASQVINILKNG